MPEEATTGGTRKVGRRRARQEDDELAALEFEDEATALRKLGKRKAISEMCRERR